MTKTNSVQLTKDELAILGNVLNEVLFGSAPKEEESFVRMSGASKKDVEELLKKITTEFQTFDQQ